MNASNVDGDEPNYDSLISFGELYSNIKLKYSESSSNRSDMNANASVSDTAAPASHSDPSASTKTSPINAISLCAFGRSDRAVADTESDERPWPPTAILLDVPDASPLTFHESECELLYCETTRRDEIGHCSTLPFKGDVSALGDSARAAQRRYYSLKRKLLVNPSIKREYDDVFY
ncbi:hypothetical protein EVAR_28308_1 [Eumeta japonica]|uniref:Uncharacterized protein n=1 Tax=Eumeta variegata TaxID=151549 RepID=A0A4C1V998_EUMVA|nr:hypothetical protein EVAR_28308_1 [Eumeta japonica]